MNILPKIRAISAFHEHVQTLKRTGINEDAIAEICECGSAIPIQHLYNLSLAAVQVIKAFDDGGDTRIGAVPVLSSSCDERSWG